MPADLELYASSRRQLAFLFGVDTRTVLKWLQAGAPPKRIDGYPLSEWFAWRLATGGVQSPGDNGHVPADPKRRREYYQAARERLKYETETGQRVTIAEHERALMLRSAWFSRVMDVLPAAVAPKAAGKSVAEVKRVLAKHVKAIKAQAYGREK